MNNEERDKLKDEQNLGVRAQRANVDFITPFIEEKRLVLFEAFQAVSVNDVDKLLEIKRQLMAINALGTEMQTIVDTGNMAAKSLAGNQEEKKDEK